ncbi:hypothetical protein [Curvivirga sp.]|uniref:hypothetical protein n=1 Tax=Curvivirga sp. TaxID=2856848 RepID=UPI003B5BE03B
MDVYELSNENVSINFSKNEAIVFYSWLAKFNDLDLEKDFESEVEQQLLWNIEASFEKVLSEPFMQNFDEILKDARHTLKIEK